MPHRLITSFLFFCTLCTANTLNANELEQPASQFDKGQLYFYIGDFDAEVTVNELEHPTSEFGFGMGVLFDYVEHIDWGIDLLLLTRKYDTPAGVSGGLFTIVSDEMTLDTFGLTANVRFSFPTGKALWYAGINTGIYLSKLSLTASTFGFPGTHEEKSNDFGYSYYWGMTFNTSGENYLGIEYRFLSLKAGLSPVTSGSHDVGGELLFLIYSYRF